MQARPHSNEEGDWTTHLIWVGSWEDPKVQWRKEAKTSRDETRAPLRVWTGQKKDISSTRVTSVTVNTRGERGTEFKKKHKGKQNVCYGVFFIFEFFEEIMPHIFSYVSTLLPCDTFWGETQVYDQIAISLGLGFYIFIFPNRAENKNENK